MRAPSLAVCLGVLALSLAFLAPLRRLEIRVSEREMLADDSLAAEYELRARFGDDRALIAAFERQDGELLTETGREDWRQIVAGLETSRFLALQMVDPVDGRRFGGQGQALLAEPPPAWLERALEGTHLLPTLQVLESRRGVLLHFPQTTPAQQRVVAEELRRVFEPLRPTLTGAWRLRLIGQTVVLDALGREIEGDLLRMVPLAVAFVLLLLTVVFRSPAAALLAALEVGISTLWTLGLLRHRGHDLSLMTALLPVLIMTMGVADEIHLFAEFFRLRTLEPGVGRGTHAWRAAATLGRGITATSLTTAVSLFSFTFLDIPALRVFGQFGALGVLISWLLTLTFVPAVLTLVPIGSGPLWATPRVLKLPWRSWRWCVGLAALGVLPGIARLRLNDAWSGNFSADHELVRDVRWLEQQSTGLHRFDVALELVGDATWEDPGNLAALEAFQAELTGLEPLNGSVSLVDLLRDRAWELRGSMGPRPPLPGHAREVRQLVNSYRLSNEATFLGRFLDRSGRWTALWAYLDRDDYATAQAAQAHFDGLRARHFGDRVRLQLGGSAERGRTMIGDLVTSQLSSLFLDSILCYGVLVALFGEWLRSARCLALIFLGLALLLGAVGWIGLPLGVASSAFLGISLGTGIDYGVHLEFSRVPGMAPEAARDQLRLRVLFNVAIIGAGMAVLLFSDNPTIRTLGGLILGGQVLCGSIAVLFAGGRLGAGRGSPDRSGRADVLDR